MAIAPIQLNDTQARAKMNAAIVEANKVAGKADAAALQQEVAARQLQGNSLQQSIATRALYSDVGPMRQRPGEPGRFFAATLEGEPSTLEPIGDDIKILTADGRVARLSGAKLIGPIAAFRVEPGRQYRARFVFRRSQDSEDPANDAVRLGLRWLKNDKSGAGDTALATFPDILVANGRLEYAFNFARVDAENIDAVAPADAVYVRPYLRTYSLGVTDVEVIEVTDLTLAADYSPDLTLYMNEIAGLQQRLDDALARIETLEGA